MTAAEDNDDQTLMPAFLNLVENSMDSMLILGEDGSALHVNKAGRKLLGIDEHTDTRGMSFTAFHTPEQVHFITTEVLPCLSVSGKWSGTCGVRNVKTGAVIPVSMYGRQITDSVSGKTFISTIIRDLPVDQANTKELEKKIAKSEADLEHRDRELVNSEERYHKMIEEVEDYAILLLDPKGNVQNWNRGAERIKGYTVDEIVGRNFRIFYLPEDQRDGLPERLIGIAYDKGKALHEGWRVRKDGTRFWGSVAITALHDEAGNVVGFSKVTRDLTEKKNAEERILQYTRDLEFQNQELEQFAYAAAHDMKEPLRKIRFYNDYLSENLGDNLTGKNKDYMMRSINAASRMQGLIDDLLKYSQASSQSRSVETVDLQDIVSQVINLHSETIQQSNAIVEAKNLGSIEAVTFQVRQLLDNLVGNSLKYQHPDRPPHIVITTEAVAAEAISGAKPDSTESYIKLTVRDNGRGFETASAEKIFDLFERLDSGNTHSGSGIGLAICKKIAQNHKGFITAEGEPGKGASIAVYFPKEAR